MVDETINDELILLHELNEGVPGEAQSDMKRMKLLEDNYDKLYEVIHDIYKKHDELLRDVCAGIERQPNLHQQ